MIENNSILMACKLQVASCESLFAWLKREEEVFVKRKAWGYGNIPIGHEIMRNNSQVSTEQDQKIFPKHFTWKSFFKRSQFHSKASRKYSWKARLPDKTLQAFSCQNKQKPWNIFTWESPNIHRAYNSEHNILTSPCHRHHMNRSIDLWQSAIATASENIFENSLIPPII